MKLLTTVAAVLTVLSGCAVDPQVAAERRANLMAQVFPEPADRQGLYLVFPLESGGLYDTLLITHFEEEVSRAQVVDRVARYCARLGSSRLTGQAALVNQLGTSTRTRPDGRTAAVFEGRYDCTAA
ncbi:MAG: hypothetical protein ABJ370_08655 [Paracoccaceae bacterium]